MNRIFSLCVLRDSTMPLIPSPGSPKTTSTPQSNKVSTNTSAAVIKVLRADQNHPVSYFGCNPKQGGAYRSEKFWPGKEGPTVSRNRPYLARKSEAEFMIYRPTSFAKNSSLHS